MNRNESPYLPLGRQGRIYEPLRGSEWMWMKRRCDRGLVENLLDPELVFFYSAIVILMYIYSIHSRLNFCRFSTLSNEGPELNICFVLLIPVLWS